tara:strand:+ start:2343 stop:3404 length:1062 start_codon:yes stop_codon:yes gene_type:complete
MSSYTFSRNFKAAVLIKQKQSLKIMNIKMPTYLDQHQVLVKIIYTGICGSQIGEIDGVKGKDNYLPHLLGHEGSAEVIKIGPKVKSLRKGDYVTLHWKPNDIKNAKPYVYSDGKNSINSGNVTSFSEYSVVSENRLTKISKKIALNKISALLGCCLLTGFGVVKNDLKVKKTDKVAIFGVGGLGLANIIYLKKIGVRVILSIDIDEQKLKKAKTLGSNFSFNLKKEEKKLLKKKIQELGINKIIENTGSTSNIEYAYESISSKGTLCLVGVPPYNKKIKIHTLQIHFGKRIIGSHGGTTNPKKDINYYLKKFKKNNFRELKPLIAKVGKLNLINKAIKEIKSAKINGRYLIRL